MSTRALISIRQTDDDVKHIYIHHGHPSDIGGSLLSDYNGEAEAHALINGGDISSFGKDGVDNAADYYKDRPDEDWEDVKPKVSSSVENIIDVAAENCIDFVFYFIDGGWQVACTWGSHSAFDLMPLKDAMEMIAADEEGRW